MIRGVCRALNSLKNTVNYSGKFNQHTQTDVLVLSSLVFDNVDRIASEELVFLGAVQHGVVLLADEKRASEGSGLRGARSAFLTKVPSRAASTVSS